MGAFLQLCAIAAILTDGVGFQVGTVNMNSERLLLPIVASYLFVAWCTGRRLPADRATICYVLWIVTLVISAALTPSPAAHINGFLICVSPLFYYLLFRGARITVDAMGSCIEWLLWIVSIAGILIYGAYLTTGAFAPLTDRGRLALLMMEPNILGSTVAALALAHFGYFRRRVRHLLLYGLVFLLLLATFSKAPYVAFAVGSAYYFIQTGAFRSNTAKIAALTLVLLALFTAVVFPQLALKFYVTFLDRPDAISNRMYALLIGWKRFLEHPIFGNGPLDFSLYNPSILDQMGTDSKRNMWIWQMVVAILHDSGLVGGLFFALFVLFTWRRGKAQVRRGHREYIGYMSALLALIISSQLTTVHLTAIFGVTSGLVASVARRRSPAPSLERREGCLALNSFSKAGSAV